MLWSKFIIFLKDRTTDAADFIKLQSSFLLYSVIYQAMIVTFHKETWWEN